MSRDNEPRATLPELVFIKKEAFDADCPQRAGTLTVVDDRSAPDPSFRIVDSYRVTRRRDKRACIAAILAYDAAEPSDPPWRRSEKSMLREWDIHNVACRLRLFLHNTADVDLNNAEEGKGWLHFFYRGLQAVGRRLRHRFRRGRPTPEKPQN